MPPSIVRAIDAWCAKQQPIPSRSEAIRIAVVGWLTGLGLLKHRDDPEGMN
jgi:hypothetical protein